MADFNTGLEKEANALKKELEEGRREIDLATQQYQQLKVAGGYNGFIYVFLMFGC